MALLLVYYGKGKGKTTAAFGLVVRALGHGWRILIAQFMKLDESGEVTFLRKLAESTDEVKSRVRIYLLGSKGFVIPGHLDSFDASVNMCKAYGFLKEILPKELEEFKPKLVLFDELGVAIHMGIVDEVTALEVLETFSENLELHAVVTGRYVPKVVKEKADLISEVREVKHYFRRGHISLPGLDM